MRLNQWVHVLMQRDHSIWKLYLNGVLQASASGNAPNTPSAEMTLSEGLQGKVDDLRIYNRVLSAAEVKQLANAGASNIAHSNVWISDGLVGYWTMDGSSIDWRKNQMSDMSGNGNTGSLVSLATSTAPVAGKIGQALSFDGNGYIAAGDINALDGASAITISG